MDEESEHSITYISAINPWYGRPKEYRAHCKCGHICTNAKSKREAREKWRIHAAATDTPDKV